MSTQTAPNSRTRKLSLLLRRALTAALVTTSVALLAPAAAASASVTYTGGTVSAGAFCNRYNHTMTIQGAIVLSTRYPQGATVATHYAYYTVNGSLQATSAVATTGWLYSNVPASTIVNGDLIISNNATNLPALNFNAWGHFRVMVQVGVWNGRSYDYSNWDTATGYDNYGQYGIYSYNNVCLASVT